MGKSQISIQQMLANEKWIRPLVRSLIRDEHLTEDVVQDTWVATFEHPGAGPAARPWLRKIALNFALRRKRSDALRRYHEPRAGRCEKPPSPEAILERESTRQAVVDAVRSLEEPYRIVVLYRFFENLPPRKIAKEMGISAAAVKTRLNRGFQQLRARLDRRYGGDRRAWCLGLLSLLSYPAGGAATAASSVLPGAAIMSTKTKIVAAVAAVIAAGVTLGVVVTRSRPVGKEPVRKSENHVFAERASKVDETPEPEGVQTHEARPTDQTRPPLKTAAPAKRPPGIQVIGRILDDARGRPVSGGRVWLGFGDWNQLEDKPTGVSDDQGSFRLRIAPGNMNYWMVFVEARGFAPHRQILTQAQRVRDPGVDMGDIRIHRGALVQGRVVRKHDERPVGNALLLWTDSSTRSEGFLLKRARAAGQSRYNGTFVLNDRLPPIKGWGHTLFAVSKEGTGWTTIHVVKNRTEVKGVEVLLNPPGRTVVTVLDSKGSRVPHARVVAEPRFSPIRWRWSRSRHALWVGNNPTIQEIFTATTDKDGIARFPWLPTTGKPVPYDFVSRTKEKGFGWKDDVLVSPDRESKATLVLSGPVGRHCTLSGFVKTGTGSPVAGAVVKSMLGGRTTKTDERGHYRLDGIDARFGSQHLEVSAPGFTLLHLRVKVVPSREMTGIDFVLYRFALIEGRVVDQHGVPGAGVRLCLNRDDRRPRRRGEAGVEEARVATKPVTTGSDGRFSFPDAPEGRCKLTIDPPAPRTDWGLWSNRVVHGGDRSVVVVLNRLPAASVRFVAEVVHARTGELLDPSKASFRRVRSELSPPNSGHANPVPVLSVGKVTSKLRPGCWKIQVRVENVGRAEKAFQVRETDTEVFLRVEVGEPGTVIGRVVLKDVPPAFVPKYVCLRTIPHSTGQWVPDDESKRGRYTPGFVRVNPRVNPVFRLVDVPSKTPVRLEVLGSRTRMLMGCAEVVVPPGGTARVDIPVTLGGLIRFRTESVLPEGQGQIEIAGKNETWKRHWVMQREAARLARHVVVHPGQTRWRSRCFLGWGPDGRPQWSRANGQVNVKAGETAEVVVPVRE